MLFLLFLLSPVWSREYRIAFGSCYNFNDSTTPVFQTIIKSAPDLFLWLGDAAYLTIKDLNGAPISEPNVTMIDLRFNKTKHHLDYKQLASLVQIEGVWDDHDYNQNDGDKHNQMKEEVREKYLNFLDVPINSERRTNPSGIYFSFLVHFNIKIQLIMLDVRWNRDPKNSTDPDKDILGPVQWEWLEQQFNDSASDLIILCSGSQIMPDDRLFIDVWYDWSRQKLYDLLDRYRDKKVLLLSGDVHFGELMQHPCRKHLHELTSSGLSYSWMYQRSFIFKYLFQFFAKIFLPDTYSTSSTRYAGRNYALIRIQDTTTTNPDPTIVLEIHNDQGQAVISKELPLTELSDKNAENDCTPTNHKWIRYFYNLDQKLLLLATDFQVLFAACLLAVTFFIIAIRRSRQLKQKVI